MTDITTVKQRFGIIGTSELLDRALEVAVRVAPTDLTVLVTGESGVGKEFFPQVIHAYSARKHNKYIAVNCGAIPEGTIDSELFGHEKGAFTGALEARKGYFEEADGGTIFLDEVAELPLPTQARLLRVLQTGEFIRVGSSKVQKTNVRVVAATNMNLQEAIASGRFREDLYYRLNTVPIVVPALRERPGDIPLLFRKFASDVAQQYRMPVVTLDAAAREMLCNYYWRGNIRQLKNVAEQISAVEEARGGLLGALRRAGAALQGALRHALRHQRPEAHAGRAHAAHAPRRRALGARHQGAAAHHGAELRAALCRAPGGRRRAAFGSGLCRERGGDRRASPREDEGRRAARADYPRAEAQQRPTPRGGCRALHVGAHALPQNQGAGHRGVVRSKLVKHCDMARIYFNRVVAVVLLTAGILNVGCIGSIREKREAARIERDAVYRNSKGIYRVGDFYDVDGKRGVVFQIDSTGRHGKILSLREKKCQWDVNMWIDFPNYYGEATGATSEEDGRSNWNKIVKISGWRDKYPAFAYCETFGEGWYLPAYDEWSKLYMLHSSRRAAIDSTLNVRQGHPLVAEPYWTSSESDDATAWDSGGTTRPKNAFKPVRAIAAF